KVILDLIALKSILEFHRSPLFGFGLPSVVMGVIGIGLMVVGVSMFTLSPDDASLVVPGIGVLLLSLCIFLVSAGILCELIYATGDVDIKG
ncbi:MAG: hypothetical protein R3282_01795, partial [Rhodothermales bacterium]|nr:hypothetical protein [Rhodothermales bacterium]